MSLAFKLVDEITEFLESNTSRNCSTLRIELGSFNSPSNDIGKEIESVLLHFKPLLAYYYDDDFLYLTFDIVPCFR